MAIPLTGTKRPAASAASRPAKLKKPKKVSPQVCKDALESHATHCAPADDPDAPPANKGCTFKCYDDFRKHHGSYKYNGYTTILNAATKRAIYDIDFTTPPASTRIDLALETDFGFSNKPAKKNFRAAAARADPSKTGNWSLAGTTTISTTVTKKNYQDASYAPFNHQYHHIMPWESLYLAFDGQGGTGELTVLQAAGYNLNRGINVIILPMAEQYAWAMQLPTHFSGHPAYNISLAEMLNEVKAVFAPATPHTLTAANAPALKTCVENWEIAQFPKIAAFGQTQTVRTKKGGAADKAWLKIASDIRNCPLDDMMDGSNVASAGRTPV